VGGERCLQGFGRRSEGKRPLRRLRRRWEDNIKMDLREMGINGANWFQLVQNRVRLQALVNTVTNFRVPQKRRLLSGKQRNYGLSEEYPAPWSK
jgi:hypothetical protein